MNMEILHERIQIYKKKWRIRET